MSLRLFLSLVAVLVTAHPARAQVWEWARSGGGSTSSSGTTDQGRSVDVDAAGNAYVVGNAYGSAVFGDTTLICRAGDVFVAKYAPDGDLIWARNGGSSSSDEGRAGAVDGAGNVYVTGDFGGTATFGDLTITFAGARDMFLVKYDADGEPVWARRAGGAQADAGRSVATDGEGNVYATGFFTGQATFGDTTLVGTNPGADDVFVVKYNPSGAVLWARQAGSVPFDDLGKDIATDAAGNVYVTGNFGATITFGAFTLTSTGGIDVFVVKYDPSGTVLWARRAGGLAANDNGLGITADSAGQVYVTGDFRNSATFGGGISVASAGLYDAFVVKYAADGTPLWARRGGGAGSDVGNALAVDGQGIVSLTGAFEQTATFGPFSLAAAGDTDAFVVQYGPDGTELWADRVGAGSADEGLGIVADATGHAFATGHFRGTVMFGDSTLTSVSFSSDVFVARLAPSATASEPIPGAEASVLRAYPNPSGTSAVLSFDVVQPAHVRLALYDGLGREVGILLDAVRPAGRYEVPLDVTGLSPGLYVARLTTASGVWAQRLTVVR